MSRTKKPISKVTEIQVADGLIAHSLGQACQEYIKQLDSGEPTRAKIHFSIKDKNGKYRAITIRDDDDLGTVAYGDFYGLSDFLEYAEKVTNVKV